MTKKGHRCKLTDMKVGQGAIERIKFGVQGQAKILNEYYGKNVPMTRCNTEKYE